MAVDGNELDKLDAHKQFFLRRSEAPFRASQFSMILCAQGWGFWAGEGL